MQAKHQVYICNREWCPQIVTEPALDGTALFHTAVTAGSDILRVRNVVAVVVWRGAHPALALSTDTGRGGGGAVLAVTCHADEHSLACESRVYRNEQFSYSASFE